MKNENARAHQIKLFTKQSIKKAFHRKPLKTGFKFCAQKFKPLIQSSKPIIKNLVYRII